VCALRGLTEPFEAAEGVEGVEKDMEGIYGKFFRLWRPRYEVTRLWRSGGCVQSDPDISTFTDHG